MLMKEYSWDFRAQEPVNSGLDLLTQLASCVILDKFFNSMSLSFLICEQDRRVPTTFIGLGV